MAYRYQGGSNLGLVDTLEADGIFQSARIRQALLAVPRGQFCPPAVAEEAYLDRPLRLEEFGFNISAPHMYAVCLQNLELQPGHAFLDVGSGCGHFTALGAYLVGPNGISVGIDINKRAVEFSRSCVADLRTRGLDLKNISFERRNVFISDLDDRTWDRIHVGASCPQRHKHTLYELLRPGGVLVMPLGNHLIRAEKDENEVVLEVRYGELELPSSEEIAAAARQRSLQVHVPHSHLNHDYLKMFNNSFLSDVTFLVDGEKLYGHKAILASRCEYFASLYHSGMKDAQARECALTHISYAAFREVLRFIYTDECVIDSPDVAGELIQAAEFYRLDRMKVFCEYALSKALDVDSASAILEVAHCYNAAQLKRVAFEFILEHYDEVSQTSGFETMQKDCYREILHVAMARLRGEPTMSPFGSPPKS